MSDLIGGEVPLPPSKLESPLLRAHGKAVVAYCFRKCYETWPELNKKYGERGKQHVARDSAWHLEYLDEAVSADEPIIFASYADWLAALLEKRGIGREQVAGAFGFLAEALEAIECTARQQTQQRAMVAILKSNQARLLAAVSDPIP